MSAQIRRATRDDIPFIVSCNRALAEDTEGKELDKELVTNGTTALFDDDRRGFYLIAEVNGVPVGQLMVTYEWSDWRNGDFWWIQSVYVMSSHRKRGIFKQLYQYLHDVAQATPNVVGLRLYVDVDNKAAQETYSRLGMLRSHYSMFELDFVL
eukprot:EC124409.1.p1 GENE.EC124409.1~~EC124409.1.p1  ORF type:complete len:153 (+),score=12.98 EC124409.1:202-660(+)